MKYKLKYSPNASDKLRKLNRQIIDSNGKQVATRIVSKIMGEIRGLQNNPKKVLPWKLYLEFIHHIDSFM